ncbi:MAG: cytochrome c [Phycisphaerales bacterium]|nr:cytochrome c [Phycisphaerales bacterium]
MMTAFRRSLTMLAIVMGLSFVLSSCATPSGKSARRQSPSTGHWVYSQRLRAVMGEIDRQARTAWPQEVSAATGSVSEAERAEALGRMDPLAAELAAAARRIPDTLTGARISEGDRRSFQALVDTLGEQAESLKARITSKDLDAARRVLTEINATCVSCHDRFRDLSGPMLESGPQRADAARFERPAA